MSQEHLKIVRRMLDARDRGDLPAAFACLDPDVEFIPLRAATEGIYNGHEGVETFISDTSENFESFQPHYELAELGERVLAWGTILVRGRGSGVEMEIPSGGIFDLHAGKITRWQDFGSKEKALEAVGLSE
jgi:ketosteroid isomerase-like protein